MGEKRKISELVPTSALSDDTEFVFVHYPSGSHGPTPLSPSYVDGTVATAVCLKDAEGLLYNNLILSGSFVTQYDHNSKPYYEGGYDQSQLQSTIWWRDDGWWLIQYRLWEGFIASWGEWTIAYYSPDDVADPTQVTTWGVMDNDTFTPGVSVEPGLCSAQVSEKSYSVHGNAYVNGYDMTYVYVRITGEPGENVSANDFVYLENMEFSYDACGSLTHVNLNEKFYTIADVDWQTNPETNAPTWDLKLRHNADLSDSCGLYITDTGTLTVFSHIGGGPTPNSGITLK